jgi:hypothetical protein
MILWSSLKAPSKTPRTVCGIRRARKRRRAKRAAKRVARRRKNEAPLQEEGRKMSAGKTNEVEKG